MMWWCSPNITQSPFTSPGAGQHLICWFYTCKNNVCLFVIQQTISGKSGGEGAGSESGGGVDLLRPQSSNMRFSNWKVNTRSHQRSARGGNKQKIPLSVGIAHTPRGIRSGTPFRPWVLSLLIPAPHAWVCRATSSKLTAASPFFCMGWWFFPSILSESSGSHNQSTGLPHLNNLRCKSHPQSQRLRLQMNWLCHSLGEPEPICPCSPVQISDF